LSVIWFASYDLTLPANLTVINVWKSAEQLKIQPFLRAKVLHVG